MSWTIQWLHRRQPENVWTDYSGNQAFLTLEHAVEALHNCYTRSSMEEHLRKFFDKWQWRLIDKDTGEEIPAELFL